MQPNKPKQKRFRGALLFAVAFTAVAAASVAGASGWVASAQESIETFLQRDEFRALAAVLTTSPPETEPTVPAAEAETANLATASLCWWETLTR